MHTFSRALLGIYRESTKGSLHEFQAAAVQVLHDCLDFDAVVLGGSQFYSNPDLYIMSAHIDGLPRTFMDDYIPLLSRDPIMKSLLTGLGRPLKLDLQYFYENCGLSGLADFARLYKLRQMMIFGDIPCPGIPTRWIMLFKDGAVAFPEAGERRLVHLWPHLSQATSMCDERG
ncbi:hypothetical protein AB4Z19_07630 [Pseudoduganella sp. RAF19]|uniref:hypothetical protein n=2 Tax=unclassified Pseudoduganella TaxID=2637179 RepID=UPI003F950BCA